MLGHENISFDQIHKIYRVRNHSAAGPFTAAPTAQEMAET